MRVLFVWRLFAKLVKHLQHSAPVTAFAEDIEHHGRGSEHVSCEITAAIDIGCGDTPDTLEGGEVCVNGKSISLKIILLT